MPAWRGAWVGPSDAGVVIMKRTTPMRRTAFVSKTRTWAPMERPPRAMPTIDPARFRLPQPVSGEVVTVAKATYIRSKALREAYRLIPCQSCGANDGTVVCAHANEGWAGKGMGIKASDENGASLCFTCHSRLDQGSDMTKAERRAFWLAAHMKTIPALVAAGHWPKDIQVPAFTTEDRQA